ncbi:MAG: hypothetical protein WC344_05585 [Bacilli bacterium]|jgi:hypothetical protein
MEYRIVKVGELIPNFLDSVLDANEKSKEPMDKKTIQGFRERIQAMREKSAVDNGTN